MIDDETEVETIEEDSLDSINISASLSIKSPRLIERSPYLTNIPKTENELGNFLMQQQQVISHLSQSYLHIRSSSLRGIKPALQAKQNSILAIRRRLEEIHLLYRISLAKRYQLHRQYYQSKSNNFEDIHLSSSPLDYRMIHWNVKQILIQPEHFPRITNSSGLYSLRRTQSPTSQPPSTARKHPWIDYTVINNSTATASRAKSVDRRRTSASSVRFSSSISPDRNGGERVDKRNVKPSSRRDQATIQGLWEGSEYKIQLLVSLYKKLLIKLAWEYWSYLIIVKKLLKLHHNNVKRLQFTTIRQLSFTSLIYSASTNIFIQLSSQRRARQYLTKKNATEALVLWHEKTERGKRWKRSFLFPIAIKSHYRHLLKKYISVFKDRVFICERKKRLLKQFSREYSSTSLLLLMWKRWQGIFLQRHSLRVEIMQRYHPKRLNNSLRDGERSSTWSSKEGLLHLLRYTQHNICKKYSNAMQMVLKTGERPRNEFFLKENQRDKGEKHLKDKDTEEGDEEERIDKSSSITSDYLKDYERKRQYEIIQEEMRQMMTEVMQSKAILPHSRFDNEQENEEHVRYIKPNTTTVKDEDYSLNTSFPLSEGRDIRLSRRYRDRGESKRDESVSSYDQDVSIMLTNSERKRRKIPLDIMKKRKEEMKLSEAFSQSLLNLTLQDQIAGSNSSTSTNESEANEESYDRYLSKEKRGRLWKFLQLKQIDRFVTSSMIFFHLLKGMVHRRRAYDIVQHDFYHQHLLQDHLQHWKHHYQRRYEYQEILYDQYCRQWLTNILQTWSQYLQNKYNHKLQLLQLSQYKTRHMIIWKQWRLIFHERRLLQYYQQQWSKILKKYHFKHWNYYINNLKEQRNKVKKVYCLIYYQKYFKSWYDKYYKKSLLKRVFSQYAHNIYEKHHRSTSLPLVIKSNFQLLHTIFTDWKVYAHERRIKRIEEHQLTNAFYFRGLQLLSRHFISWKLLIQKKKAFHSFLSRKRLSRLQLFFHAWKNDYFDYLTSYEQQQTYFTQSICTQKRFFKTWKKRCYSRWQYRQDTGYRLFVTTQLQQLRQSFKLWRYYYNHLFLQRKRSNQIEFHTNQLLRRSFALWKRLLWKYRRYRQGVEKMKKVFNRYQLRNAFYHFPSIILKKKLEQFTQKRKSRKQEKKEEIGGFYQAGVTLVDLDEKEEKVIKEKEFNNLLNDVKEKNEQISKTQNEVQENKDRPTMTKDEPMTREKKVGFSLETPHLLRSQGIEEEKNLTPSSPVLSEESDVIVKEKDQRQLISGNMKKRRSGVIAYTEEDIERLMTGPSLSTEIGESKITTDVELAKRLLAVSKLPAFSTSFDPEDPRHSRHLTHTRSFIKERKIILPIHERAFKHGFITSVNDFLALREILVLLKTILAYWLRHTQAQKLLDMKKKAIIVHRRNRLLERCFIVWMKLTPRIAYRFVTWMRNRNYLR